MGYSATSAPGSIQGLQESLSASFKRAQSKVAQTLYRIADSTDQSQKVMSIVQGVFKLMENLSSAAVKLGKDIGKVSDLLDAVSIIGDVRWLRSVKGAAERANASIAYLLGKAAMITVDVFVAVNYLAEVGLVNLEKAADAVGKLSIFGKTLPKLAFDVTVTSLVLVGYVGFAFDGAQKIYNGDRSGKTLRSLGLNALKITGKVGTLLVPQCIVPLTVLSIVANSLALGRFLYFSE